MRRKWIIIAGSLLLVVGAIWGGSAIYANVENSKSLDQLALSTPTAGTGPSSTFDATSIAGKWHVADGSQAGYRVKEVLNGQNVTVVGRTDDVEGQATIDGSTLSAATATVTMAGVATDNGSRDSQFQGILKTQEFPTSTFVLTTPVDIGPLSSGPVSVQGAGDLTVAGVTRPVTVSLEAQATDGGVEVQGSIPIVFSDFGIDAPNLGFVKVEGTGTIEMLLQLTK
ncbi:YceI family protein [Specibacter sp. AOP5-B1-6]|uniref:YceI family protein n=1 Tax=Specibacter sp. AOP5-B1-6 TaxID=3457653 RepID=UPI00402B47E0